MNGDETSYPAIRVVMMPRDTNPHGTIFGGVILSYIDMAGAIGAGRAVASGGGPADAMLVTVAINRVEFKEPVLVGDVVCFETSLVRFGRTSVTIRVEVFAERGADRQRVTEAEVVYVRIGGTGTERRPVPVFTSDQDIQTR